MADLGGARDARSSSGCGGPRGPWPPWLVKICHKKDNHQRRPHWFHVSRPPYPAAGSVPMPPLSLLPAATKLWPRLCFYTCLWFCSQGGSPGSAPPGSGRENPPRQAGRTPPDQADPPGQAGTPPRQAGRTPQPGRPPQPRQGEPPQTRQGEPPWDTVYERPVRILLECILVFSCSFRQIMRPLCEIHWNVPLSLLRSKKSTLFHHIKINIWHCCRTFPNYRLSVRSFLMF